MIINGVDTSNLPDTFGGYEAGRTLIIDGDGPCYVASATAKTLPTAIRRFQQRILSLMFLAKAERAVVHLTHDQSYKAGRFNVVAAKPYQANRGGKAKPALLGALRAAVALEQNILPDYDVVMHHNVEADDGMIMDAYRYGASGVIHSEDKDLRCTPYPYFDIKTGRILPSNPVGYLEIEYTASGNPKCVGRSHAFFWAQMLMGDTADNVMGIRRLDGKLCGPVAAYNALQGYTSVVDMANFVLDAYRKIDQNPIPEGIMMWLLRTPLDSFLAYLSELALTPENQAFVLDQAGKVQMIDASLSDLSITKSDNTGE